jgi:hypothetical protein
MLSTHPYTDDIRGNHGRFQGCVVVSTQLSGSNPDARTSLPTYTHTKYQKRRTTTVQIPVVAPSDPHTRKKGDDHPSSCSLVLISDTVELRKYYRRLEL